MHNYFSEMTLFKSEMLTLPFPFSKNESINFSSRKFPKAQAIVVMDNFLLGVYLEAISKNSTIQAQLPNRLSIKTVNELLQAIESIFLPQSPDAIARRQSLFHKLTQGEGESTSALFNRILLYFRMFEYTLRTKDLIDLIGCMYMTFKNRNLFVQTRDKCLSAAKNGRLDIQAISRNIVETESAMRDLGQTLVDDALSEQLFLAHQDRKICNVCNVPGHIASRCPNRVAMGLDSSNIPAVNSTFGTQRSYALQQHTSSEQTPQRNYYRGGDRRRPVESRGYRAYSNRGGRSGRGRYGWRSQNLRYSSSSSAQSGRGPTRRNSYGNRGAGGQWNSGGSHYVHQSRRNTTYGPGGAGTSARDFDVNDDIFHNDAESLNEHASMLYIIDCPPGPGEINDVDVDEVTIPCEVEHTSEGEVSVLMSVPVSHDHVDLTVDSAHAEQDFFLLILSKTLLLLVLSKISSLLILSIIPFLLVTSKILIPLGLSTMLPLLITSKTLLLSL